MKRVSLLLAVLILASVALGACGTEDQESFDLNYEMKNDKMDLEGVGIVYELGLTESALAVPNCLG